METVNVNELKRVKGSLLNVVEENKDNKTLVAQLLEIYESISIPEASGRVHEKVLGIDYGTRRVASCVDNNGGAFLIPGNRLVNLYLQASNIGNKLDNIQKTGNNNHPKVEEYEKKFEEVKLEINALLTKAANHIIDYSNDNDVTKIVAGKIGMATGIHIDYNNQRFSGVENFEGKLINLCARHGIEYVSQDESYTSQADFLEGDYMPTNGRGARAPKFSGERIKNDYHSASGITFNADINAALNILRKHGVDNFEFIKDDYLQPENIKL